MRKQTVFSTEAFSRLKSGVDKLAAAVVSTLGPDGKNVIIQEMDDAALVTKDGVTVAKHFDLEDTVEKLGVNIVREAALKVNKVGDGTTTTTLLARDIIDKISTIGDIHETRKTLLKECEDVCAFVDSIAVPVESKEMLTSVATISANNDAELGQLVAEVVWDVGRDGVVTIEESPGTGIEYEKVEGFQIASGYAAREMATSAEGEAVFNDVPVLVTDKKLTSAADILPLLEKVATGWAKKNADGSVSPGPVSPSKQLVIIADGIEGDALGTIVVNKIRGAFNCLAVKAPFFAYRKESLEDLAAMVGATVISSDNALKLDTVKPQDLGYAKKVVANRDFTTFFGGNGKKDIVVSRIADIDKEISLGKLSDFQKQKMYERKGRLAGKVAVVKVGGFTEAEIKEKKFLVEDAVASSKAALDGGIVAGGGVALFRASRKTDLLKDVLCSPLRKIAGDNVPSSFDTNAGYDAKNHRFVDDMISSGIIDPAKVVKTTLQSAVSVASLLLTTDCVLYDDPKEKE